MLKYGEEAERGFKGMNWGRPKYTWYMKRERGKGDGHGGQGKLHMD